VIAHPSVLVRGKPRPAKRYGQSLIHLLAAATALFVSNALAQSPVLNEQLQTKISLTFKNLDCTEAFKILSEKTEVNFAVDAGVKGAVTLYLTDVEAGKALEIITGMTNNAYVIKDGIVRVMTGDDYIRETGRSFQSRSAMLSYALKHIPSNEAIAAIGQLGLLTAGGKVSTDPRTNGLIVWDTPEAQERVSRVLELLDKAAMVEAIPLANCSVESVLTTLQALVGNLARIDADPQSNRLIVSGSPEGIQEIRKYLGAKDVPPALETEFIALKHAWSDTLLAVFQDYLTPGAGQAALLNGGRDLSLTEVSGRLPFLRGLVQQLDVLPDQVLIEVKILQVSFGGTESIGINWDVLEKKLDDLTIQGRFPVLPKDAPGQISSGVIASAGDLEDEGYNVLIEALSTYGETEIVSLPRLLVTTGREAQIHVGSTEPYVSVETQLTQGIVQNYERVTTIDVGVKLRVLPTIHPNGLISMVIEPEVSSVSRFFETPGGSSIPVVDQSTLLTEVTVNSGDHVILGGLMETEKRKTERGVPILRSIPLLKYIFGSTQTIEGKTELVIVIRPRIVSPEKGSDIETETEW